MEEDTVEDDGKPDCETSRKIGNDDNGNGQSRRDVVRESYDLGSHEGIGCET